MRCIFEACFKVYVFVYVFTGMDKQLLLHLHQAVGPVCIFTMPVAVPVRIVAYAHIRTHIYIHVVHVTQKITDTISEELSLHICQMNYKDLWTPYLGQS